MHEWIIILGPVSNYATHPTIAVTAIFYIFSLLTKTEFENWRNFDFT